jgi:hypothetical protein
MAAQYNGRGEVGIKLNPSNKADQMINEALIELAEQGHGPSSVIRTALYHLFGMSEQACQDDDTPDLS